VLIPVQDFMLDLFDRAHWPEYAVPRQVARKVREFWKQLHAIPSQSIGLS
jgi:hypothetical protein